MSINFSRRRMIFAGGAALAVPTLVSSDRRAEAQLDGQLSASGRAVSTLPGSDPYFLLAVENLFPGLTSDPVFRQIAPLALLVTHRYGPPIRAFSASWTITTPTGTYEAPLYFYVSVGSPKSGHILSGLGSARRNILWADQSRLISPFFNWTPAYYRSNPPNWKTVLAPTELGSFLVSELSTATQVKVSLDGVVFSDWKLMGPDKHGLEHKIRTRRNAEHDEGLVVHKLLKSGASDSEIVQTLEEHASAQRSNSKDRNQRWYERARKVHAQVLLKHFQNSDRHVFAKTVVRLKKRRKTRITRLAE